MSTRQPFGRLPLLLVLGALFLLVGSFGWQFVQPYAKLKQEEWKIAEKVKERNQRALLAQQYTEHARWTLTKEWPWRRVVLKLSEQSPVLNIGEFKSWGFTQHTGGCMDLLFNSRFPEVYCPHKGPAFPCGSEGCRTVQFKARDSEATFLMYAIFSVVEVPFKDEFRDRKAVVHPGEAIYVNLAYMTRLYTQIDVEWRLTSGACITVMLDGPRHAEREACLRSGSSGKSARGLLSELTAEPNSVAGIFFIPYDADATIEVRRL
jgi:hypothetical protein